MNLLEFILQLLFGSQPESKSEPQKETPMAEPKVFITLEQYAMGRDKTYFAEWTNTIQDSANVLLQRVNALLNEIQLEQNYTVSSGWRPAAINAKITNAAKRSNHMRGKAVDIADVGQNLSTYLLANLGKLEKYGLWMEDPKSTKTWVHLQSEPPASGRRVFIP